LASFAASIWSRSSGHGPTFGRGCTWRPYSKAVAPERSTLRTVFRDTFSSRTISLIDLPLIKCSRLIRPIVSTTCIPHHPLASPGGQPAHHIAKGVKIGRRLPLYRGQSSTPKHNDAGERSVKGACRRSPSGAMMAAWQRQQRKCPLSA
jgi:hypothetical protein